MAARIKTLTVLERRAIRSYGGWRLAELLTRPDAKPSEAGQGGNSHPAGFPKDEGYWLDYKGTGITVTRQAKTYGADRTEPEVVVKVTWRKVFWLGAGMTADLRKRMVKACQQNERHARQGWKIKHPRLVRDYDGDREAFAVVKEKFDREVWGPHLATSQMLKERIDSLLDEAVGSFALFDAQDSLAKVQEMLARSA